MLNVNQKAPQGVYVNFLHSTSYRVIMYMYDL